VDGNIVKSFNSEFGRTILYTYHVGEGFYIEDPGFDEIINIYPNPSSDKVNVDINDLPGKITVSIYDMQGKLLLREEVESDKLVYDISNYPQGFYLFEIKHKSLTVTEKVIKM
jgi:hypothetical protein